MFEFDEQHAAMQLEPPLATSGFLVVNLWDDKSLNI
jgi:hypothetical protein